MALGCACVGVCCLRVSVLLGAMESISEWEGRQQQSAGVDTGRPPFSLGYFPNRINSVFLGVVLHCDVATDQREGSLLILPQRSEGSSPTKSSSLASDCVLLLTFHSLRHCLWIPTRGKPQIHIQPKISPQTAHLFPSEPSIWQFSISLSHTHTHTHTHTHLSEGIRGACRDGYFLPLKDFEERIRPLAAFVHGTDWGGVGLLVVSGFSWREGDCISLFEGGHLY